MRMTANRRSGKSPARAIAQGLCAGVLGTAVFTAFQELALKRGENAKPPADWGEAPEPAQVGHRVLEGVFGKRVPLKQTGTVTNVVHWAYGSGWGAAYGVIEESLHQPLLSGFSLTGAIMVTDYTLLPMMGLYEEPWKYPARVLARDFATHLVHGIAVAAAYRALDGACLRS